MNGVKMRVERVCEELRGRELGVELVRCIHDHGELERSEGRSVVYE